jgi:hypothetical protein
MALSVMRSRRILYVVITVGCVAAFFLASSGQMQRVPGALLVLIGALAIIFAQDLATTQTPTEIPIVGFIRFRPLTARLWGVGMVIVGCAWLFT